MSGPAFWESLVMAGRAIYFPNIPLRLVAPTPQAAAAGMNVVTFITIPQTTKTEIRNFLQTVYKVEVSKVHTINYEGKKKRAGSKAFFRKPSRTTRRCTCNSSRSGFRPRCFRCAPRTATPPRATRPSCRQ